MERCIFFVITLPAHTFEVLQKNKIVGEKINYLFMTYFFLFLQEVRLLGSVPRIADFENCSELREVAVGNGGGGGAGAGEALLKCSSVAENAVVLKKSLVLKGCQRLDPNLKDWLRACIMG